MADSSDLNNRARCAALIGIIGIAALFAASHSNALTDDAANVALPSVTSQTQTQIDVATPHDTVLGTLVENGVSTNQCDNSIQNFALATLTQNTKNPQANPNSGQHNSGSTYAAYQSPHYNYTCTNGWGAFDGCSAHGENWLMWPPTYDIQCQVTMPTVSWTSP